MNARGCESKLFSEFYSKGILPAGKCWKNLVSRGGVTFRVLLILMVKNAGTFTTEKEFMKISSPAQLIFHPTSRHKKYIANRPVDLIPVPSGLSAYLLLIPLRGQEECRKQG